jgi:phosphatidylglycerol:prolipoprotein diacylglycerol transferase
VAFPHDSPPWREQVAAGLIPASSLWSLPVHPTQLYSAIDGFVLLFLLTAYYPLRRRDGAVMALLMVAYPVTRFLIEYLRNDEKVFFLGLTISQNISVLLLGAGLLFWFVLSRRPRDVDGLDGAEESRIEAAASRPGGVGTPISTRA